MKPQDRTTLMTIIAAMPQYVRQTYENIVDLILDDMAHGRCEFPDMTLDRAAQEMVLFKAGNRCKTWIEVLTNLTLSVDNHAVFTTDSLTDMLMTLMQDLKTGDNPFRSVLTDEDEDDEDDPDALGMDDIHVNEAIQAFIDRVIGKTDLLGDETFVNPNAHLTLLKDVRMHSDTMELLLQVLLLFDRHMKQHHKVQKTIRKERVRTKMNAALRPARTELLAVTANVIYTGGFVNSTQSSPSPVQAVNLALVLLGMTHTFGVEHVVGLLKQ